MRRADNEGDTQENFEDYTADILIVEDDEKIRQTFCVVVSRLGHSVRSAECFRSACEKIDDRVPDMVLTDWNFGTDDIGSGVDVVGYALSVDPTIKVVMITGNDIDQLKHQLGTLPVDSFVKKPVDLASLRTVLNQILNS